MQSLYNQTHRVQNVLKLGKLKLDAVGIHSSALEARLLLEFAGSISYQPSSRDCEADVAESDLVHQDVLQRFLDLIEKRTKRVPIAHLLGKKELYSLEFAVNSDVLIPRPDSEVLIDEALRHFNKDSKIKILELGIGSGCLLLTLLKYFPNASGVGIDISQEAIKIAKQNYENLGLRNCVEFVVQDWKNLAHQQYCHPCESRDPHLLATIPQHHDMDPSFRWGDKALVFDLILSNPPYIPTSHINELEDDVKLYEPHIALDGGQDGVKCYQEILPIIHSLLSDTGRALIECGFDQNEQVAALAFNHSLQVQKILYDLSGIARGLHLRKK